MKHWLLPLLLLVSRPLSAAADRVLFDFESGTFEGWTLEGTGFGVKPFDASVVSGWRADRRFAGWHGRYMVIVGETRHEIEPVGRLVSAPFIIDRPWLRFNFGAELRPQVRVMLWVEGRAVRTAHGENCYDLRERGWEVRDLAGRTAQIVIEKATAEAALLRADYFRLSDEAPPPLDRAPPGNVQESALARPGEYRLLWSPPAGELIEHHNLVRGPDRRWHLFGSFAAGRYGHGRALFHAVGDTVGSPFATVSLEAMKPEKAHGEAFIREPFVLVHEGVYHCFYVGNGKAWSGWDPFYRWKEGYYGNSTQGPWGIFHATSPDGTTWTRAAKNPLFTDTPFAFTPFVTRIGGKWVMYYAGTEPADIAKGVHGIIARTSDDLKTWSERRVVFLRADPIPWPEHSFVHSPQVFERGGRWHLFAGPIDNLNQSRFHYRQFFESADPLRWETPKADQSPLKGLFVDGGAKILADESGRSWISTSGVYAGGVWIAPLSWGE